MLRRALVVLEWLAPNLVSLDSEGKKKPKTKQKNPQNTRDATGST